MKFENIYRETEENMRLALLSLWTPGNHPMRPAIEELFDREPLLAEPVFQSTFGWEPSTDDTWRSAINKDVWNKIEKMREDKAKNDDKPFRPFIPFKHQAESWETLAGGKSIVVTSGTGSGKTECFMYPVLSDLYEQGRTNAIEAIFLYPLNALMEDQKERLSEYCEATGLHFAVYNGDTPEYHADGRNVMLKNEIATREAIRDTENRGTRPEILLTNPSMLEYILVRQKDQQMLQESAGKLRWIVIDEAHSYSGSAAVELGYQIKRILEAFGEKAEEVRFACTSATIGGEDGAQSLAEFISTVTGQSVDQIRIIGGNRLVRPLDKSQLASDLQANNLPSVDRVLSLRNKINEVSGMTLQQMWEWLCPETPFDKSNLLPALQLLDKLCEMSQGGSPVLSLRAHFFMRSINGLYACANPDCKGGNPADSLYGHLTTYKASVCPECGATLLEIVQCKRCGGFVLMGCSDSQTHKIYSCEDEKDGDDYFAIDTTIEQDEEDEMFSTGRPDTFFLMPYEKEKFFNPVGKANVGTMDILHDINGSVLNVHSDNDGQWVEVRIDDGHSYCPSCGKLALGKRLNFKHFRIPISFINQTISPVLLRECAPEGRSWGKYIAFTDSRQGTAISAKTFNINVERNQSCENILERLAQIQTANPLDTEKLRESFSEEQIAKILACAHPSPEGVSLYDISESIYNKEMFDHLSNTDGAKNKNAYKAALIRGFIGRRPLYEKNAETMGLIYLDYPSLKTAKVPNVLADYAERNGIVINDKDWQDYLKLAIDYVMRLNNHIQPLVDDERQYVRDSNLSSPIAASDDNRENLKRWPSVKINEGGDVSDLQNRLVVLLCAGMGIHTLEQLQSNYRIVDAIIKEAWNTLIEKKILTKVNAYDTDGYNNRWFYPNNKYVDCYYLDLSGKEDNYVCKIKRLQEAWVCPVTNQILDTTFCGYSPLIVGRICEKLFAKYKCSDTKIILPSRPKDNDEVVDWLKNDANVKLLKEKGLWTDRHKYSYQKTHIYLAAEHSAQQPKWLLRQYTKLFIEEPPQINVLHCSTTMEMGVNIGDIDIVLMDTVPPTAANYLQRAGRAGRMGQTKAIAFSLCNNTPVGQQAFANPMWALQTTKHMANVRESQTIIQRHINSFFFRQFICNNTSGIKTNITVDDFMTSICDHFVQYLDDISTNQTEEQKFHVVFGPDMLYTVNITKNTIVSIKKKYDDVIDELKRAFDQFNGDVRRQMAINNQIQKIKNEGLLKYLSENQFVPNANMPTGVVTFVCTDQYQAEDLKKLYNDLGKYKSQIYSTNDSQAIFSLQQDINKTESKIKDIKDSTTASRDIRVALNEYAPGQTVVVNEKNYVSAGISLFGAYNEETQTKAIYHCIHCGHTEYKSLLDENATCPVCEKPYHSIIDTNNRRYTLAYEPVGFKADECVNGSREEKTEKRYYDIRPVLLETNWSKSNKMILCEIASSGETGKILFYNVGKGYGFAFCKRCGRAAIEDTLVTDANNIPNNLKPGHKRLWGDDCDANNTDIARNVVFTGLHPTCYVVLRFMKDAGSSEYENDKELVYSLGVVIKRALAKSEGIDEGEVDFGIKQERFGKNQDKDAWLLFIYDTAKGGCGYSTKLMDPVLCQKIFDMALDELQNTTCNCQVDGGACTRCLIDRNNYHYSHLLSKAKALDWLNRQKDKAFEVPATIKDVSPTAEVVYKSLKDIVKQAINNLEVKKLTLCVSDETDDYNVTDWSSVRSEMGRMIKKAIENGKTVALNIEYHPELHNTLADKLPFINLKDKFPDCEVSLINDMGTIKTAIIVETLDKQRRYFPDNNSALSFSNNWGNECTYIFTDEEAIEFERQEEPSYTESPKQVIREGITNATRFEVKKYFSKAIAPAALNGQDVDMLSDILSGKHVDIFFSDMYVNSALASLMLVYLIKDMKDRFGFAIDNVTLQLDSPKRKCENDNYGDYTYINNNFACKEDADQYTDELFQSVLDIDPEHSLTNADHHRWLRFEVEDGGSVEIRPDHGISGGYRSNSKYGDLDSLDGTVCVEKNYNEDVLYYVIIKRGN